jgi:predicted small lipoprotein YifL
MSIAREITLAMLVSASLAGCGSVGKLDESPAQTIDLSGNWSLNHPLSDDPKPVIEKLRPRPMKHRWDMPPDADENGPPESGGQQDGGQRQGGRSRRGDAQGPQMVYRSNNDAYTHSTVMKVLMADLARADNLTIQQSPERFSLDYGSTIRSFTPGARSVVSAAWGVADQSSGWKGKEFVIQVKPQTGVASVETFGLSKDGQHLVEELRMGGGEFPEVKLKRVYDRAEHPVSRAVPTTD